MRYAGLIHPDPLHAIPLFRPASILRPFDPLPRKPAAPYSGPFTAPDEHELHRSELVNAEAALAELVTLLAGARAGIGEANRTHTAPVMCGGRVVLAAQRFSAERMRERKSFAFRLFNKRRGQIAAARRRVDAARAAMGLSALAVLEQRAASAAMLRASKAPAARQAAA